MRCRSFRLSRFLQRFDKFRFQLHWFSIHIEISEWFCSILSFSVAVCFVTLRPMLTSFVFDFNTLFSLSTLILSQSCTARYPTILEQTRSAWDQRLKHSSVQNSSQRAAKSQDSRIPRKITLLREKSVRWGVGKTTLQTRSEGFLSAPSGPQHPTLRLPERKRHACQRGWTRLDNNMPRSLTCVIVRTL